LDALGQLSQFIHALESDTLPADISSKVKACLLYGLAVGIGARGSRHPRAALAATEDQQSAAGFGATTLLGATKRAAGAAAFCNAALFHARIQEDAHPAGHMGVVVIPAALAVCEEANANGRTLLCSIVAGYETALRIGRAHSADLSLRGFRTTSAYGPIGAAAAASRARHLPRETVASALALAANFAGGLREFVDAGSDEFPFQAGFAAQGGILAAALSMQGVLAAPTTLSGRAGFFRAFGRDDQDYESSMLADLGETFEFSRITYKPYPACQFLRGVIRGAAELSAGVQGSLRGMRIRLNPFESEFVGIRYAGPFERFPQTFMSARFCAALAWSRGSVTFAGLHDFNAADVLSLIPRMEIEADAGRPRYRPRLEVVTGDGRLAAWEETEGEDAYRLDWQAAAAMARSIAGETNMPPGLIDNLIGIVSDIEQAKSIGSLVAAAAAACQSPDQTPRSKARAGRTSVKTPFTA
jgi:2-methylcitrate dehydratase PrpD